LCSEPGKIMASISPRSGCTLGVGDESMAHLGYQQIFSLVLEQLKTSSKGHTQSLSKQGARDLAVTAPLLPFSAKESLGSFAWTVAPLASRSFRSAGSTVLAARPADDHLSVKPGWTL
jgi:hypothetical protein